MAKKNHKITIDKLQDAIMAELNDFDVVTGETVRRAAQNAADKAVDELHSTSPSRTGKYAASWTHEAEGRPKSHKYTETVYAAAPEYRLTHLLEKGHAKVNGGRTKAMPHISTAEQNAITNVVDEIKTLLGRA